MLYLHIFFVNEEELKGDIWGYSLRPFLFICQPTKVATVNVGAHLSRPSFSRYYSSIRSGPMSLLANEFDVRSVLHGK